MTHRWMTETVMKSVHPNSTAWDKNPHPALTRLSELEHDGWDIVTVSPVDKGNFVIVAKRGE